MASVVPVIWSAAGEHRKATVPPSCSGHLGALGSGRRAAGPPLNRDEKLTRRTSDETIVSEDLKSNPRGHICPVSIHISAINKLLDEVDEMEIVFYFDCSRRTSFGLQRFIGAAAPATPACAQDGPGSILALTRALPVLWQVDRIRRRVMREATRA